MEFNRIDNDSVGLFCSSLLFEIINSFPGSIVIFTIEQDKPKIFFSNEDYHILNNYYNIDDLVLYLWYNTDFNNIIMNFKEIKKRGLYYKINNENKYVGISISHFKDKETDRSFFLLLLNDITKRINYKLEIEYKNNLLKQKNKLIKNMVNSISHKFSNYLMPILIYSDLWLKRLKTPKKTDKNDLKITFLQIKESAEELKKFTTENIKLIKYKSFTKIDNVIKLDLYLIINKSINFFDPYLKKRNVKIKNRLSEKTYIYGTEIQIQEVIDNLVSNAAKYAPENSEVIIKRIDENNKYIIIGFIDTGKIIDDKNKENIFKPYYRIKDNLHIQGDGIGLSLCKEIMNNHNGEIWVDNYATEKEQGNIFYLKFYKHNILFDYLGENK